MLLRKRTNFVYIVVASRDLRTPFFNVMIELGTHDIMLFDGDCGVCTKSAEFAREMARTSGYAVEPYQRYPESAMAPFGFNHEQCARKLHVVTRKGRVYSGAFAVNHFCWRHGWWRVIPIIIYVHPPLLLIEIILYALVARNRYHISRWLGLTACAVPQAAKG